MNYHVFFNDSSIGLRSFATRADALNFINTQLTNEQNAAVANYTLIHGDVLELEASTVVLRARVKQ